MTASDSEFRFIVEQAEDGVLEAYCIDCAAVGTGATSIEAVQSMVAALNEMHLTVQENPGAVMRIEPSADELALYESILNHGQGVPEEVHAAGTVSRSAHSNGFDQRMFLQATAA